MRGATRTPLFSILSSQTVNKYQSSKRGGYGAYMGLKLERSPRIHTLQECWTLWCMDMLLIAFLMQEWYNDVIIILSGASSILYKELPPAPSGSVRLVISFLIKGKGIDLPFFVAILRFCRFLRLSL